MTRGQPHPFVFPPLRRQKGGKGLGCRDTDGLGEVDEADWSDRYDESDKVDGVDRSAGVDGYDEPEGGG